MEINKVGTRGTLFTFYDLGIPTNVYVINGNNYVYIIDTYLGPDIMKKVNEYIEEVYGKKQYIVINTHSHWDHVWGNCLYASSLIIAHEKCKEFMQLEGLKELEDYSEYKRGEIIHTYPNLTFTDKILFEEDGILIYHSPGHTEDEISVQDMKDKVLFTGDNLERPIPYLMWKNLKQYVNTLESYLEVEADVIIGGHTTCEGKNLISDNLNYVKKVVSGDASEYQVGQYADYHKTNIEWLKES